MMLGIKCMTADDKWSVLAELVPDGAAIGVVSEARRRRPGGVYVQEAATV